MPLTFKGYWNAAENSPHLVDGIGTAGDCYTVSVGGVMDLGSGPITFVTKASVIYTTYGQWLQEFVQYTLDLASVYGSGGGGGGSGTVTSVDLSMPSAFSVTGNPITTSGTIAVSGAGSTSDYIRGDGTLATFPSIPTVTPSPLTKVDDINVTLSLGGTPATSLLQPVSITAGWLGTLADNRISSASVWNSKQSALYGAGYVYQTSGATSYISGTSSQFLKANGSLDSSVYLVSPMTTTGDMIYQTSGSTASRLPAGISAQVLTMQPTGVPAWTTPATGITIGTTPISSGTSTRLLYDNAGVVGENAAMTFNGSSLILTGDATVNTLTVGLGTGSVATSTTLGYQAMLATVTGADNTGVGYQALKAVTSGADNTALGYQAGLATTTASQSTAIGSGALPLQSTTATGNTAVGYGAGYKVTTASSNTFIGANCGGGTGSSNTGIGASALNRFVGATGGSNTAVGYSSLNGNSSGANNVAIGVSSGSGNSSGHDNIYIGYSNGSNITTQSYNVLIGSSYAGIAGSNQIFIADGQGNLRLYIPSTGNLLIGTTTDVPSSILTLASTSQGLLPPRMTTTQKNAISSPAEGLMVYDLTLHKLCVYTGSAWETITSA